MANTMETFQFAYRQKHIRSRVFFIFCLLGTILPLLAGVDNVSNAATYYLDAVNGDDNNPGSEAQPWATIQRAMPNSTASPKVCAGDTVYIKNGNYGSVVFGYDPNLYSPTPSSWETKITYAADTGATPEFLHLSTKRGSWYLEFDGIHIVDTSKVYNSLVTIQAGRYVTLKNMYLEGSGTDEKGADDWTGWGIFADDWSGPGGPYYCKHLTVENCEITRTTYGIDFYYVDEGITIKNNHIHFMASTGIKVSYFIMPDTALVEGNLIENQRSIGGHHGSGISLRGWPVILRNNTVRDYGRTAAISLYSSAGDWGSATDGYQNLLFENNLVYDAHNVNTVRMNYLGKNCTFRNNTFISKYWYGDRSNAKWYYNMAVSMKVRPNGDVSTIKFYNNIVVGMLGLPDGYTNMQESGNVIWCAYKDWNPVDLITADGDDIILVDTNNNAKDWSFFEGSGNFFVGGAGFDTYSFQYGGSDGGRAHGVDLGNSYSLASGSASIGFADASQAPEADVLGNTRDAQPDAGCYEYISADSNNHAPVLQAIGDKSVNENVSLNFTISATDSDGDTITYLAQNLPSGATFAGQTFSWTPGYDQAGSYEVTFIASDGQAQDSKTITITVNNVNRAPVLDVIGDKSANENSTLSFTVSASDGQAQDSETIYTGEFYNNGRKWPVIGGFRRRCSWGPTVLSISVEKEFAPECYRRGLERSL